MYFVHDKRAAIKEIQKYLLIISQSDPMIPHITTDGYYNAETVIAVSEFQRSKGLVPTGKVDKETFDLLYFDYSELNEKKQSSHCAIRENDTPYKIGSSGPDVYIMNILLSELSLYYDGLKPISGDFFSRETESAVNYIHKMLGQEQNGMASGNFIRELHEILLETKTKKSK